MEPCFLGLVLGLEVRNLVLGLIFDFMCRSQGILPFCMDPGGPSFGLPELDQGALDLVWNRWEHELLPTTEGE